MELLFVALGGAILGLGARYAVPRRRFHGVVLVPAVGTGVAAVVWVALTWLGMPWDGGWIWVVSLVASAAAAVGVAYLVGRRREDDDARTFERLARFGLARG
ncbi:hypothetical protein [Agromyces marinus]|uniref:Integral membrane protein n=1 Tax=Agromyces marinus TaxID=1389020 RepID=A0ABN6YEU7_9MICO|nr:hypothetical protein [Agromyces marinus]UIP59055.1 hypothetical protein DSM26151_19500 [Agromyces marinus]BDZ55962.1 hypothetical protein GCM10025870_30350 [Agromyces marinus]